MVDIPTPESFQASNAALQAFSASGEAASGVLQNLGNMMQFVSNALTNTEGVSTRALAGLNAFSVGVMGVRKSFEIGFNTDHINTFEGQLTGILNKLETNGTKSLGALSEIALGAFGSIIPSAIRDKGIPAIEQFIKDMATSADNALRLENALFRMGAVTGGMGKLMSDAGSGFQNMNDVLMRHQKMITDTAEASGNSTTLIEQYWQALGQVPKALESQVTSARDSSKQISMLDATMQYAVGSGREFKDVVADLAEAHLKMGLEGEVALKFTARIGELANKNGVEFSAMHSALKQSTDDIKNFGGEGMRTGAVMEGVVGIMNNYLGALKQTGVSGATATGMIQDMTKSMLGLDIAQRAFLSQQSGGSGGLRGAFQIEQMIRDGNGQEVMAKMQKSIEDMTGGKMVSVNEAAGSEEAAQRAVMQRQMIMQGPLGKLAGDEQGAARIAEMFANKTEGKMTGEELAANVLQQPMEAGLKFQESSDTHLGAIRRMMEATQGIMNITSLGLTQTMGAARVGTTAYQAEGAGGVISSEEEMRQSRLRGRGEAGVRGGGWAEDIAKMGTAEENTAPVMQRVTAELGNSLGVFLQGLGPALRAPVERLKKLIEGGDKEAIASQREAIEANINSTREKYKNQENSAEKFKALENAAQQEQALAMTSQYAARTEHLRSIDAAKNAVPKGYAPNATLANEYSIEGGSINANFNPAGMRTPGQKVGAAANSSITTSTENAEGNAAGTRTNGAKEPVEVDVKVTGMCIDCGRKITQNPHISPAGRKQ